MKNVFFMVLSIFLLISCSENNINRIEIKSGTIENKSVLVSSKTNSTLLKNYVREGSPINKGDTLAILDSEKLKLQLNQTEANMNIAQIQLEILKKGARIEDVKQVKEGVAQAQIVFKQAQKNLKRIENLYQSKAISEKDYDDAKTQFNLAKSRLVSVKENSTKIKSGRPEDIQRAEALVNQAKAQVELIKDNISDCVVLSPITGIVTNKFVEEGENVTMLTALFKIIDNTNIYVDVYLNSKELAFIKINDKVKLQIDAFTDKYFDGVITYISDISEFTPKNIQTKDERTKLVYSVRVDAKNSENYFKSGMPVDVIFE